MSCLDDPTLARLADGELTTNQTRAAEAHLDGCASCQARRAHVGQLARALGGAYATAPDPSFARSVAAELGAVRLRAPRRGWGHPAIAVGLTAFLAFLVHSTSVERAQRDVAGTPSTLVARGPDASLTGPPSSRNVGFSAFGWSGRLTADARLPATPDLRFRVYNQSGRDVAVMLFAVDARRQVHWFYPAFLDPHTNPRSIVVPADRLRQDLDEGVTPEDLAPGPLTMFGLFSEQPLDVRSVESLVASGRLHELASPTLAVHTLSLEVEETP